MFKKRCLRCKNKTERKFDFCPYCGYNMKKADSEDYGFLGKDDVIEEIDSSFGFGGSMIDKLFSKAMKELPSIIKSMEQQMNNETKSSANFPNFPNSNMKIRFAINGKEIPINQITQQRKQTKPIKISNQITQEKAEKIAKLPRIEPKSTMKRLSGKIVYELEVPGVEDIKDILINKLENSIEVKAISKNKVYLKNLNINLPLLGYGLNQDNLIIEFQAK